MRKVTIIAVCIFLSPFVILPIYWHLKGNSNLPPESATWIKDYEKSLVQAKSASPELKEFLSQNFSKWNELSENARNLYTDSMKPIHAHFLVYQEIDPELLSGTRKLPEDVKTYYQNAYQQFSSQTSLIEEAVQASLRYIDLLKILSEPESFACGPVSGDTQCDILLDWHAKVGKMLAPQLIQADTHNNTQKFSDLVNAWMSFSDSLTQNASDLVFHMIQSAMWDFELNSLALIAHGSTNPEHQKIAFEALERINQRTKASFVKAIEQEKFRSQKLLLELTSPSALTKGAEHFFKHTQAQDGAASPLPAPFTETVWTALLWSGYLSYSLNTYESAKINDEFWRLLTNDVKTFEASLDPKFTFSESQKYFDNLMAKFNNSTPLALNYGGMLLMSIGVPNYTKYVTKFWVSRGRANLLLKWILNKS